MVVELQESRMSDEARNPGLECSERRGDLKASPRQAGPRGGEHCLGEFNYQCLSLRVVVQR